MVHLGSTIRYVRETKGLSQQEAASDLEISNVHLCNLERDKANPSPELLARINDAWKVDLYVLSWCLNGDLSRLPPAMRKPMEQLVNIWRSELKAKQLL